MTKSALVDNVKETRSYDITKKNRSLIACYNSQFNSVVIGKIQGIDETQRPVIKHFHIDMSQCTDTHTYVYQCMEYRCAANASLSSRSPCTFSVKWECLIPLLTDSQFVSIQPTNLIEFNIFDIFDFAKKKYELIHRALMQNHISDLFDIPHVEFYSTIDKWPSAYRGELLAVLLALSVIPKNSKVRINTDSLNVITQFEKLKKSRFSQTSREYFKANNNFLWAILCRIILTLNLHVKMFKVVAHGDDMGNNYVDNLAKIAHTDQDRYIVFQQNACMMKVLPCWNGIVIENKLRSFLKNICNYKGLEKFINLTRNSKYRTLEVDWTSTFSCLNCDINNNETSVSSSKMKAQKVHLLIEEIPTIEQMKKSLLALYDGWMCLICGLQDETFNHVWTCSGHYDIINNIRDKTINHLLTWILDYNDNIQDFNALMALNI
ncbi:ribonuclease H-like domain-containing protein [Rhizophagus irregularis DAOM 181602=DAOM 197198]|nr:ribonuclease H-like domain-containing protein [Rhizophagus irregularis DAOM 181602=DAOM 197198]